MSDPKNIDLLSAVVLAIGLYEGVMPFLGRYVFDSAPLLSLPAHLSAPAWWIVSSLVIVVSFVLLVVLDNKKKALSD